MTNIRFLIIFRLILLRMNVSDKIISRENKKTHFMLNNFFSEKRAVNEIMWIF